MESQAKAARDLWTEAQKVNRKLCATTDALAKETTSDWSHLEDIIAKHRLACVQILILDPEFFCETVQGHMWSTHSLINNQYRQTLHRLRGQRNAVAKSKLEKLHVRFLKTSFDFYKHYVQQLATKYGIPELQKAARKTNQQIAIATDKVPVGSLSPSLKRGLLLSCAMAIVHIGDLTRYLTQARTRKPKKNESTEQTGESVASHAKPKALEPHDYYNLASQLLPSLGHPYHQNGVMFLEEKNDFEVVFHFIKAVAVERPHPMASQNLDQKFKLLRTTEASIPIASQDPTTIFKIWFIRLQGGYFGDGPFDRQEAIEKEVLGRLRVAIQLDHDAQVTLMKMTLINIAAHYVAKMRLLADPESESAGRTLYRVLRHNIQSFGAILIILKQELIELKQQMPLSDLSQRPATSTDNATDRDSKRSPGRLVQYICMPLVRLYSSWLVATSNELGDAAEDLNPGIIEMCTYFASVLTLLSEIYGGDDMKITPYLLPEDMLARGLLPLSSPLLSPACELGFDQDRNIPKADWEDYDESNGIWGHDKELLARALDILLCGFNLTEEGPLPFKWTQVETGLKFHYESPAGPDPIMPPKIEPMVEVKQTTAALESEPNPSDQLLQEASQAELLNGATSHTDKEQASKNGRESHERHDSRQRRSQRMPPGKRVELTSIPQLWNDPTSSQNANMATMAQASPHVHSGHGKDPSRVHTSNATYYTDLGSNVWDSKLTAPFTTLMDNSNAESTDYDFSNNTAVMDMVNDFLQPPTNSSRPRKDNQPAMTGQDTSYGMHSATADEIFNVLAPKSPTFADHHSPRAFPGLPWNLIYEPSPNVTDGYSSPKAPVTPSGGTQRLADTTGSMDPHGVLASNGHGPAVASKQWSQHAAASSGASAVSHRARLLQAFGQPAAASSSAVSPSRSTSQDYGRDPYPYSHGTYFPGSAETAFSNASSVYQSTPQNGGLNAFNPYSGATAFGRGPMISRNEDPTAFKNMAKSSGIAIAEDYADAYNNLVMRSVREDVAKDHEATGRFT